jgi:alkylation response protein AidB-like acyl-CoA dehydrogenase
MDFNPTEEQRMFRDAVRGIAERHCGVGGVARAHADKMPMEIARAFAAEGLMGITIPEVDGGQGGSLMDAVIAIEEVSMVCPRSAEVLQAGNFGAIRTLAAFGSDDQKARYLPALLAGEKLISLGMSEPDAGSAVTDLRTSATSDGEGFRINGSKIFGTHSAEAETFLIYVRFGPGTAGIGSVLLERGMAGFTQGEPSVFMNSDVWQALYFDNVFVPAGQVLLGPGGFAKQMAGFNAERIGNTARSLAFGSFAFEAARRHAMERQQFGRPLCEFQGLQWKFADIKARLEGGRLLLYRAAAAADNGLPNADDTALAKLVCNEAGFVACDEAMQIMGGAGFSQDFLVEYCFRKTRGWRIAGGSSEMMRNRIAEGIFERRFSQRPLRSEKD